MPDRTAVEQWRSIPGYVGYYEASDHGRVRSLHRVIVRRNGSPYTVRGCVREPFINDGWLSVVLSVGGVLKTHRVHALVLTAFVGPCPDRMEGCHGDGDFNNNHLWNLRWDTHSSNTLDKGRHGTDHNRNKDECPRDHLLVSPNLVKVKWARDGWRECLACHRAKANANYAKRCGRPFDFRAAADRHYMRIMPLEVSRGMGQEHSSRRPQGAQA